jgi:hypothetical protein
MSHPVLLDGFGQLAKIDNTMIAHIQFWYVRISENSELLGFPTLPIVRYSKN